MDNKLRKILFTGVLVVAWAAASAQVQVHNTCIPVMIDRTRNVVAEICIENTDTTATLDGVEISLGGGIHFPILHSAELIYTGGMSSLLLRTTSWAMKDQFKRLGGSQTIYADPGYVLGQGTQKITGQDALWLESGQLLTYGKNYFYVSITADAKQVKELSQTFTLDVERIRINGSDAEFTQDTNHPHRLGVGVRQSGDDGVYAYRIPGLATSNKGTLLSVYDVRYRTSLDLQDDIDVGLSRSTDGGCTWEQMRVIMDMGCWGGLPQAQNGIGDPAILVDEHTGEIFVIAVWTHAIGNNRAWTNIGQGLTPRQTSQLMLVSSRDDGRTWSQPRNITSQIKDPSWRLTLQGPGRGITMHDGTLVFALQYVDSVYMPHASITYSRDHGVTWQAHAPAKSNTTEAQVAEIKPGVVMLNMRDNRKTGRAVFTTHDMGRTWTEHPTSGALREPVCMASLLQVRGSENILGRDVLLFSNPDTVKGRSRITIKASLDGGDSWLPENSLLLDEEEGWGYSCLTMVDSATIGILYEGSTGQMVYQSVSLSDVVRNSDDKIAWHPLPTTPLAQGEEQGLSASYAGVVGSTLIAAGGANFAETSAAKGGTKCFYNSIYIMPNCNSTAPAWSKAGVLPEPAAYGVTFSMPQGVIIAGGANASGALSTCYLLRPKAGKVTVKPFAALPAAIEQAAGASDENTLYLFGGIADGEPSTRIFKCDIRAAKPRWEQIGELPEAFVQPVMAVAQGVLYIWGGFDPAQRTVADYGYRYDIATNVCTRISTPDGGTLTGTCAGTTSDGRILITGGVDRTVFAKALQLDPTQLPAYLAQSPTSYKFRNTIYTYDIHTEMWNEITTSGRTARAGSALAISGDNFFLLGGEIKPGIRTPESWRFTLTENR